MNRRALFALAALLPAVLNVSTARAADGALTLAICTGDASSHRALSIPLDRPAVPAGGDACCSKACHSGSRKRIMRAS